MGESIMLVSIVDVCVIDRHLYDFLDRVPHDKK